VHKHFFSCFLVLSQLVVIVSAQYTQTTKTRDKTKTNNAVKKAFKNFNFARLSNSRDKFTFPGYKKSHACARTLMTHA
jgi:hypothetical protein